MDPIHPIVPVQPPILPVMPTPLIGRIDRENRHSGAGENQRRRKRPQPQDGPAGPEHGYDVDERDGDDDSGLHINVTA